MKNILFTLILLLTSCDTLTDCGSDNPNSNSHEVDHRKVILEQDSLKILVVQNGNLNLDNTVKVIKTPTQGLKDTLRTTFYLYSYQESSKVDSLIKNNYIAQLHSDTLLLSYASFHYSQDSNDLKMLTKENTQACSNTKSSKMARPSLACSMRGSEILIDSVHIEYDSTMNYEFLN